jgi:hypothetical protein
MLLLLKLRALEIAGEKIINLILNLKHIKIEIKDPQKTCNHCRKN